METAQFNRDDLTGTPSATVPRGRASGLRSRGLGRLSLRAALWTAAFVLALFVFARWNAGNVNNDFTQNVWLPSRLLLNDVQPYSPPSPAVDAALGSYRNQFPTFNSGEQYQFIYPIWVAAALAPFAVVPLVPSLAIWRALSLLLLFWAVLRLLRASNPVFRSTRVPVVAAIGVTMLAVLIFRETIVTLYFGQFSIIEFAILAGIWGYLVRSGQRDVRANMVCDAVVGLGLAVLATKPQAVALAVALVALWAISRRRWAIPVSAAVALVALLVVPLFFYPQSLSEWTSVVFAGGQASSQAVVSSSIWGVTYLFFGKTTEWVIVAGLLSLVGVAFLGRYWWRDLRDRRSPVPLALPITLCVNSVISPYMLRYEHVLLLFPAMVYLAAAGVPEPDSEARPKSLWRFAVYMWVVIPFLVVGLQSAVAKEWPAVIQSATMLGLCIAGRLRWES